MDASVAMSILDGPQQGDGESPSYDLVVEGTSLTASIIACAASRGGKSVLHLDSNDYYGSNSASFPLEEFLLWCRASRRKSEQVPSAYGVNTGDPILQPTLASASQQHFKLMLPFKMTR